ncbi:MAG: class I SAM-dependent methyltransferase [Phycisphaerales bacterium]
MPEHTTVARATSPSGPQTGGAAGLAPRSWTRALLEADPMEAAGAFDRSIRGLAKRLSPAEAARFLFALDSALYEQLGEAAIRAERAAMPEPGHEQHGGHATNPLAGAHPKHRLTRYHDFFLERIKPGQRVLDLGCGLGVLATRLELEAGATVVGLDMSPKNLDDARDRTARAGASVRYVVGDIVDVAAGRACEGLDAAFDVLVLSNVLEHLPDRPRVLRGLVERFGGPRVLIRVPSFERDWRVPYKRELGVEWRLDPTHEIEHTREELVREIEAAGLRIDVFEQRWGEYFAEVRPAG